MSFDEQVVSASIGERFGAGDKDSGRNFLEKIIQVPLSLPKAQPNALRDHCIDVINSVFRGNDMDISDDEGKRFVSIFTSYLLGKFDTPRMVARYGNAISFSLPLLCGEVNTVDLMVIEAIKITYPDIYAFVKHNPEYFIRVSQNGFGIDKDSLNKIIKKEFEEQCKSYSEKEVENINKLLISIFPTFVSVFKEFHPNWDREDLYKSKRIASPKYFDRYFSYTVIKGELSDVLFDEFMTSIPESHSVGRITEDIMKLVAESTAENFIYKLRRIETEINLETANKLAFALLETIDLFPNERLGLFSDSPRSQVEKFIAIQIRNHENEEAKTKFALELFEKTISFDFIFNILYWIQPNEKNPENRFTEDQFKVVWNTLLNRIITESGDQDVFDKFPTAECKIICIYWAAYGEEEFNNYIKGILDKSPNKVIPILRSYLTLWHSSGGRSGYGNFDEDQYKHLSSKLDKEVINENLLKVYTEQELAWEGGVPKWRDMDAEDLSDLELAKQFRHWYLLDIKDNEEQLITGK